LRATSVVFGSTILSAILFLQVHHKKKCCF
jgi:hypothetical protein